MPNASSPASALGAGAVDGIEQPGELGAREIRVKPKAGAGGDQLAVTCPLERLAHRGGAAVLPDDRVVDGPAGGAVPDDDGLALVGDAQPGDAVRAEAGIGKGLPCGLDGGAPEVFRVVLDPARPRVVLQEFALRGGERDAARIEHDAAGGGRALVDDEERHAAFITASIASICAGVRRRPSLLRRQTTSSAVRAHSAPIR